MNDVKYIVAIDLGTTKIVSIVGEQVKDGRYRVVFHKEDKSVGINHGQIENIESVANVVIPALEEIRDTIHIDIRNEYIYIGIAGRSISCAEIKTERQRDIYEEEISEKEIGRLEQDVPKAALKSQGDEILHIIPQKYSIDGIDDIICPVGRLGNKLTGYFYVIMGNSLARKHAEILCTKLNIPMTKLILEPIASAEATLDEDEKEVGVVMIDMGGGTTDVIIYKEKTVKHVAIIPRGGNHITGEIKKRCGILLNQAEKAKIICGLSTFDSKSKLEVPGINGRAPRQISMNDVSTIIRDCMREIMDLVMKEIEAAKCTKLCSAGIVITGGGSNMKGMEEFLKERTKMDVKIGIPDYIENDRKTDRIFLPEYSTAVGLMICGFEHAKTLPPKKQEVPPPSPPSTPPTPPPPPTPPLLALIKAWVKKLWDIFLKFINPQPEEKND
jgi:cell division protein FtsA